MKRVLSLKHDYTLVHIMHDVNFHLKSICIVTLISSWILIPGNGSMHPWNLIHDSKFRMNVNVDTMLIFNSCVKFWLKNLWYG